MYHAASIHPSSSSVCSVIRKTDRDAKCQLAAQEIGPVITRLQPTQHKCLHLSPSGSHHSLPLFPIVGLLDMQERRKRRQQENEMMFICTKSADCSSSRIVLIMKILTIQLKKEELNQTDILFDGIHSPPSGCKLHTCHWNNQKGFSGSPLPPTPSPYLHYPTFQYPGQRPGFSLCVNHWPQDITL